MRVVQTFVVALWLIPGLAAAQDSAVPQWPLDTGSRVRVSSPVFGRRTGTVVSTKADTLTFRSGKDATATSVAAPNIAKLEVSRGAHKFGVGRGLLIGLLVGATAGAILGAATYSPNDCTEICIFDRSTTTAMGASLLGIAGGLVGILAGAATHENWVPVTVPRS